MLRKLVVCTAILIMLTGSLYAFPRRVLVEEFTNAYCVPCYIASGQFNNFITTNYDDISVIVTHVWWPGAGDPWYQAATAEASYRVNYYGVSGVPDGFVDGIENVYPGSYTDLTTDMNNRLAIESPVAIDIVAIPVEGDRVDVAVTVTSADVPVAGNYKLRVALMETYVNWLAPNGQSDWHYGLWDMQPDAAGTDFSIAANSENTYDFVFPWADQYELGNLHVAAYIQNDNTTEVIQSQFLEVGLGPVTITLTPINPPIQIPAQGGIFQFVGQIQNNSEEVISADVWTEILLPWGEVYGPILFVHPTIPPGGTVTRTLDQVIPGWASVGTYYYYAKMGTYPDQLIAVDSFEFEKMPPNGVASAYENWDISGWDEETGLSAAAAPSDFVLESAYPNPFNPTTNISVGLPEAADLTVGVYNTLGQQVALLAAGRFSEGYHTFTFNASGLSSGIYFVKAVVPGRMNEIQKVLLVR